LVNKKTSRSQLLLEISKKASNRDHIWGCLYILAILFYAVR
jgi:hypothetical protein